MKQERFSISKEADKTEYVYNKSDYSSFLFIGGWFFAIVNLSFNLSWKGADFVDYFVNLLLLAIPSWIAFSTIEDSFNSTFVCISRDMVSIYESPIPTKFKKHLKIFVLKVKALINLKENDFCRKSLSSKYDQ